jgi:hypothetical protein
MGLTPNPKQSVAFSHFPLQPALPVSEEVARGMKGAQSSLCDLIAQEVLNGFVQLFTDLCAAPLLFIVIVLKSSIIF